MIAAETAIRTLIPNTISAQESWNLLFDQAQELHFRRGQVLFTTNRQHPYVYLVQKGLVALTPMNDERELILDAPGKGNYVNLESVWDGSTPLQAAYTLTGSTVVRRVSIMEVRHCLQRNPHGQDYVAQQLLAQIRRAHQRIRDLALLSAPQRIIHYLLQYVLQQGRAVGLEWVVQPVLTHQEIGLLTSTGRQTVTTVLNDLRNAGIVHFTRHYFIIRDLDRMKALAG
ncbi:MAG: Crp/Fnr family transcriptional regulator [Saprospiraceae bacterium]